MKKWFQNPKEFFDSFKTVIIAVFVALVFRFSVAAPYKIPSGSMIPTLKIGDFIFVSKLSYAVKLPFTNYNLITHSAPTRGDVVVFVYPENEDMDFIKRIIGVENDKVEIRDDVLYVNDIAITRKEVSDRSILSDQSFFLREGTELYEEDLGGKKHLLIESNPTREHFGPVRVPPGHVLVMGDNRDNSKDGRVWGFLDVKKIRGRALFIWLSIDTENWRIRWRRFGDKIV